MTPLIMQTAIGQGNTLVSPMHMALITCAIANDGVLMKPYLIDEVVNDSNDTVKKTEPVPYKRLMSSNEANLLGKLMKQVVDSGTASSLSGRSYTVAGKTGSAEADSDGTTHAWFVGFAPSNHPKLVVSIVVEGAGTGGKYAVPIAKKMFREYLSK